MTTLTAKELNANYTSSDAGIDLTDTTSGNGRHGQCTMNSSLKRTIETVAATTIALYTASPAIAPDAQKVFENETPLKWENKSAAPYLAAVANRYESVLFSYPGLISDVEKTSSGEQGLVAMVVSVDGKDIIIRRSLRHFKFDIHPGMRIVVNGVIKRGIKQLTFRPAIPCQPDKEQNELLKDIVAAFSTETDV